MSVLRSLIKDGGPIAFIIRGTHGGIGPWYGILNPSTPAWMTLGASLVLSLIGVVAIDTASGDGSGLGFLAFRQVLYVGVGVSAAAVAVVPHHRLIGRLALPAMIACVALLVFLLVPFVPDSLVTPRKGARAWIDLGVADFQPAELTKIAFVVVVAMYLRYSRAHRRFVGLVIPGLIAAVPAALITLQPDLGTASLFAPSLFAMLVAAGARLRHLSIIVIAAAAVLPASYLVMKPHQQARIRGLVEQIQGNDENADSINYQSFVAQRLVAAGGVWGTGEDKSRAIVAYNHLPEAHNDMVFAVITLRWGLIGGVVTVAAVGAWIAGALLTAAVSRDPFGRLVVVGLSGFIAAQTVINIGMTIGLLPIIGITLPFVSYGGSSMLASWLMTGLVVNVGIRRAEPPFRDSFEYGGGDD
ncbi:MAG: FtsW/RodA/SpoVE family cell cycle protein [Planctomycetota bacterium]